MIFNLLLENVLPLYGLIVIGFLVGKSTKLEIEPIATIMLYAVLPFVMFGATATMEFSVHYVVPPIAIGTISILASTAAYFIAKLVWGAEDRRHNLMGLLGVSSNATYFGVPVAIAMAGTEYLGVYMVMVLPLFVLDASLSYYYGVRGEHDVRESLSRVVKLPIIYGAVIGILYKISGFSFSPIMFDYWERFTGTMIVLGMMLIGAGIARMEKFRFDWHFALGVGLMRYLMWPVLGLLWVYFDMMYIRAMDSTIHTLVILICACPLAANTVAYTVKLNLFPALTSCLVLISTIGALLFIPFMIWLKTFILG